MARLVGKAGHVFAYEPGSEARALLERSRELNAANNLDISPLALSDGEREGRLVFGASSELNALGDGGAGETVRVTNLDREDALRGWPSPDFVKIDAEGQEERILAGGRDFFTRHSPLIMFEIKADGDKANENLRRLFPSIGYRLFRQLGGAPILVPDDACQPLDRFELNLFAAKIDRVSTLSRQGFLVDEFPAWEPSAESYKIADGFWRSQKFASLIKFHEEDSTRGDSEYRNSLVAYAKWRTAGEPVAQRCAALAFALRGLRVACTRLPSAGRLSTLARVAWEWGARSESVAVVQRLLQTVRSGRIQLDEPFWPASPRFDNVAPGSQPADWFVGATAEQLEKLGAHSSIFVGKSPLLEWLCAQPFVSPEMERRRVLVAARFGQRPIVPRRLYQIKPDHLNATIWSAGNVPGTIIG